MSSCSRLGGPELTFTRQVAFVMLWAISGLATACTNSPSTEAASTVGRGIYVTGAELPIELADGDEPKAGCPGEPWPYRIAYVCLETRVPLAAARSHLAIYADQALAAGWRFVGEEPLEGKSPYHILKFAPPDRYREYWRLCIGYYPDISGETSGVVISFDLWTRSDGCDSIVD